MEQNETYTMKDLPEAERPYERLLDKGAASLSDAELLAIILKTGRTGETSLDMSRRLLCQASLREDSDALSELLSLSIEELMRFPGIGQVKAIQLKAVHELSSRLALRSTPEYTQINGAGDVALRSIPIMRDLKKEEVRCLWLDIRMHVLGESILSVGSITQAFLCSREIFLEALRFKAVQFILIHNHPRGDPTPSNADIAGTLKIREAGAFLEIPLLDHIIIGDGTFFSMKEEEELL